MSLPAGVTTFELRFGKTFDFEGSPLRTDLTITPSHELVWEATGDRLVPIKVSKDADEGEFGSVLLPHTDQAGFVDLKGNTITDWWYTVTSTDRRGRTASSSPKTRRVQVTSDVVLPVDLDLIPTDGTVGPAGSTPGPVVTSVNGQTGAVTVEGASNDVVAAFVTADGPTKEALEGTIDVVVERATPQITAERPRPATPLETKLLVVFMDDDGRAPAWSTLRGFYQSKDVPVGWAITTDNIGTGGHITWDQVRTLATDVTADGKKSEILNHSKSHASLSSADLALAESEIEDAYDVLVEQGLRPEGYVWTYTDSNAIAGKVVRRRHRYGFGGIAGGGGHGTPVWTYAVGRQLINGSSTLASLKANFDTRTTGVLVYFTHATDIPSTSILSDFIDYIRARANCEIVSPAEAMSRYASVEDIGNRPWEAGYRVVTRDGKVYSDIEYARSGGTGNAATLALNWTDFAPGITIHAITAGGPGIGSGSAGSPAGNGTLETIVTAATQNGYAVQRFYEYAGGLSQLARGSCWIRHSTGATAWTAWRRVMVDPPLVTAPPTATPLYVGQFMLDTTNKKLYVATGTASSADWNILN